MIKANAMPTHQRTQLSVFDEKSRLVFNLKINARDQRASSVKNPDK